MKKQLQWKGRLTRWLKLLNPTSNFHFYLLAHKSKILQKVPINGIFCNIYMILLMYFWNEYYIWPKVLNSQTYRFWSIISKYFCKTEIQFLSSWNTCLKTALSSEVNWYTSWILIPLASWLRVTPTLFISYSILFISLETSSSSEITLLLELKIWVLIVSLMHGYFSFLIWLFIRIFSRPEFMHKINPLKTISIYQNESNRSNIKQNIR